MSIARLAAMLALVCAAPAMALEVQVKAFTDLGVSPATARCIVGQLGQGVQLDTAGEEDDEGELASVLDQYKAAAVKVSAVNRQAFFNNVARAAFKVPANRSNFIRVANGCSAGG